MEETSLAVYLAIPMPSIEGIEREDGRAREALYAMLEELASVSGLVDFDFFSYGVYQPSIEWITIDEAGASRLPEWIPDHVRQACEVVLVSTRVSLPGEEPEPGIERSIAGHLFEKYVSDLLIATNLSRIGSIELRERFVVQDGKRQYWSGIDKLDAWPLQRGAELAASVGWPRLRPVKLTKVWQWIAAGRYLDGYEGGSVGRAVCAFSRLFERGGQDEAMQLVWALVGIEALYVSGKVAVMEQVREKIQVLLGRHGANRKRIVEMYEFRSRFMHGDLDFPGIYVFGDAEENFRKYTDDQLRAVETAIAILAATLQEMIERDWTGLLFEYSVSDA